MLNLYDEAIADAKSLKEMAERNARNKIIESISPQIRRMVERQILAEQDENEDDDIPNLDLEPLPDEMLADNSEMPSAAAMPMGSGIMPAAAPVATGPDAGEEVTHTVTTKTASGTEVKINVRVDKHGETSASAEADASDDDDVEISLNKESLEALADMILGEKKDSRPSLGQIKRQFESLKAVSVGLSLTESANFRSAYAILVKNVNSFRNHVISNGGTPEVRKKFNSIIKEMKNMSTSARFRRLLEEMERKPRLRKEAKLVFEPTDLEGLDDEDFKAKLQGMTFGIEFGEEEAETPIDVSDTGAGAPVESPPPPAGPPMPSEYDDMDEEYEMDEEMYDEMDDEMDEGYDEMDDEMDEMDDMDDDDSNESTFHVDESMLRNELRRLREAKVARTGKGRGISDPKAKDFGGGKATKHLVMQSKDSDLNVNESDDSDETKKVAGKALEIAKKATDAAKEERKARVEEARTNRDLKTKLAATERTNATLREQLEEVNLFNAKLLYVNKLMQNRDLTSRQQRAIVESLDAAKSVREAKLLFTSLTESLKSKSGTVTEGRILGSSSRSMRSGSTANLNESVEVDRWGLLAGIKSDK